MNLSPEERETIINISDADEQWILFTMQKKIMTKIEKLGVSPCKIEKDQEGNIISKSYKLDYKQISFRNPKQLSAEQKQAIAERFKKSKEKNT